MTPGCHFNIDAINCCRVSVPSCPISSHKHALQHRPAGDFLCQPCHLFKSNSNLCAANSPSLLRAFTDNHSSLRAVLRFVEHPPCRTFSSSSILFVEHPPRRTGLQPLGRPLTVFPTHSPGAVAVSWSSRPAPGSLSAAPDRRSRTLKLHRRSQI